MNYDYMHYIIMFIIMIISGLLSTMNVWTDKIDDIRFSLNDFYMALLMSGWMLLFMSIINGNKMVILIGLIIIVKSIWLIRNQYFIDEKQYKLGMIPHHSMAIFMSKKIKNQNIDKDLAIFLDNLIKTQTNEIEYLKK